MTKFILLLAAISFFIGLVFLSKTHRVGSALRTIDAIKTVPTPAPDNLAYLDSEIAAIAATVDLAEGDRKGVPETPTRENDAAIAKPHPNPLGDREIIVREESVFQKFSEPSSPDEEFLHLHASQFAYVDYKGSIGGKPLASLCTDVTSGKCETVAEGAIFNDIKVAKVERNQLTLTYNSAEPLIKPLVPLEIEYKPMQELTTEEREVRETRYRELYGNRMHQASLQYRKEHGGKEVNPPTLEEQARNAAIYEQTYGNFFRDLQEESDEEKDNRDYPEGAPTLEQSVANYFDIYWPDQVEWEVTEENTNGEN